MRLAVALYLVGVLCAVAAGALIHVSLGFVAAAVGALWAAYDLIDVDGD